MSPPPGLLDPYDQMPHPQREAGECDHRAIDGGPVHGVSMALVLRKGVFYSRMGYPAYL
jgi:hypothetical protein